MTRSRPEQIRREALKETRTKRLTDQIALQWPNLPAILDRWAGFVGNEIAMPGADPSDPLLWASLRTARRTVRGHAVPPFIDDRSGVLVFLGGLMQVGRAIRFIQATTPDGVTWTASQGGFLEWRDHYPDPLQTEWLERAHGPPLAEILFTANDRQVFARDLDWILQRVGEYAPAPGAASREDDR